MEKLSKSLEFFLMLISPAKQKTLLFLGEKQFLSDLATKFDVCLYEEDYELIYLLNSNESSRFDFIICLNPKSSSYFSTRGLEAAMDQLINSMDSGGKLVVGLQGRNLVTLIDLFKLKKQASGKQVESIRLHIAYPSVNNLDSTCLWEKKSIKFFYDSLRDQPHKILKNLFYRWLKGTRMLALFAPAFIVEIVK